MLRSPKAGHVVEGSKVLMIASSTNACECRYKLLDRKCVVKAFRGQQHCAIDMCKTKLTSVSALLGVAASASASASSALSAIVVGHFVYIKCVEYLKLRKLRKKM